MSRNMCKLRHKKRNGQNLPHVTIVQQSKHAEHDFGGILPVTMLVLLLWLLLLVLLIAGNGGNRRQMALQTSCHKSYSQIYVSFHFSFYQEGQKRIKTCHIKNVCWFLLQKSLPSFLPFVQIVNILMSQVGILTYKIDILTCQE